MKKTILKILLFATLAVGVANLTTPTKAKAEENYKVTYKVKKNASCETIQKILDKAAKKGKPGKRALVTVPAGTYKVTRTLQIGSNTHLKCDAKAKFVKKGNKLLYMLRSKKGKKKGYNNTKNITVEGGSWDAKFIKLNKETGGTLFFFTHCQNVQIKDLELKNNYGTHLIELGGAKNITISGCKLHGFKMSSNKSQKEAIQIDICHNYDILPDAYPYDDSACENILIENNEIYDYPRAIGSHTSVEGIYPKDITIKNNHFHDLKENAVYAYNYRDLTVDSNTFDSPINAVVFKTFSTEAKQKLHKRNKGIKATKFADRNFNIVISNNTMKTTNASVAKNATQHGIFIYGTEKYGIKGVTISNNTINSASSGMYLRYVDNVTIDGNICNRRNNTTYAKFMVDCYKFLNCNNLTVSGNVVGNNGGNLYENGFAFRDACKNVTLLNNEVTQVVKHGIGLYDKSTGNISSNIVNNTGQNGIGLYDGSTGSITDNTITASGQHGISVLGATCSAITGNKVNTSKETGISIQGGSSVTTLSNNTLYDNVIKSIAVNGSTASTVTNNIMHSANADFELTAVDSDTPVISFRGLTAPEITSATTDIAGDCHIDTKVYAVIAGATYNAEIVKRTYTIKIPAQPAGTQIELIQEDSFGNKVQIIKTVK